jgi:hypothetical protein
MNRDYGAEFMELDGLFGDFIAIKSIVSELLMGKLQHWACLSNPAQYKVKLHYLTLISIWFLLLYFDTG